MRYITNLAEFQQLIAEETTTLVHFHDPSCNYSSSLVPAFRELSSLYSHVRFATVDTSEASADIEDMFNINSFPTLVVFKNGEKIKKYSGLGSIVKNRPKKNVSEECGDEVLNDYIKLDQIECLNIKTGYEVQNIFENDDTYLVSNDEQLIISIPFEQHVKLKSIQIIPVDIGRAPKKIKLFVNKFSFSFEDVETVEATQEYQFTKEDYEKEAVISLRATKFRCVISVVLFIENNIEDEETTAIKELVLIGSPTGTTSMKDFGDRVKVKDLEWLVETESEYAEDEDDEIEYEGDLHEYLKNHPFMNWMNKMKILRDICNQLYDIYIKNKHLYNKIHSKNIVFKKSGDCVINFEETPDQLESIKYKAPEVLCNKICDIKSDIYALGLIMWELSSNKPVFEDYDDPNIFKSLICNEDKPLRPIIVSGTPQCYNDLMEQCWNANPKERPNIQNVKDTIWEWFYNDDRFVLADISRAIDCIQLNKPVVKKCEMLNACSGTTCETLSQFVSIEASVISEPSAAEIEIIKFLINRYDDINTVLESQPVHSIVPGFQEGVPCIFCWTTESLNPSILEKLKEKFQNKYEIVCVPMDEEGYNGSRSGDNSLNTNSSIDNNNLKRKQEENMESRPRNEDDDENGDNDRDNTGGTTKKQKKKEDKGIHVFSSVTVRRDFEQTFGINAELIAKVNEEGNIVYDIYVSDCVVDDARHENSKSSRGYYLKSAVIKVSPIPETGSFVPKCGSLQPVQGIETIERTNTNGRNAGLTVGTSSKADISVSNVSCEKRSINEWVMVNAGNIGKYDCWRYNYYEENRHRGGRIPMDEHHKNEWKCVEMKGFYIEITQELQFRFKYSYPIKFLLKDYVYKANHSLKVSFKNLNNFNDDFDKLANLRQCYKNNLNNLEFPFTNKENKEEINDMMAVEISASTFKKDKIKTRR